ncbi:olfactory receptor 1G1-like isoform X1 [Hirundo rustica]|uniref:olfactory receptor 1G1-like isoform X1 n=1 Tax=Hirundo rustica TaxID=43150 RepID=UPI00267151B2|nr:olfactory receptor 1G1-like isoform X1 [Hirundo rustica]
MSNSSSISHFLLLPLADTRQLQLLHFCLFLGISLAALLANGLIISAVACSHLLHTPMFFFLLNLALTDLGSICTTVPKAMHNSLWDTRNISYSGCAAQIFRAVLRIPSEQGRHKAFSTCLPHLAVLSLFIITDTFVYLKPPSISSPAMDLMVSVLYSVVPPALNPLIYSLRNQQLKESLRKAMTGCFSVFLFSPNSPPSVLQGTERSWKRTPGLTPAAQAWHSISSFSQRSASIESLRVGKILGRDKARPVPQINQRDIPDCMTLVPV